MFAWNDALYTKLCKPCAVLDRICCSKFTGSDPVVKHIEKEIEANDLNAMHNTVHFHAYYDEGTSSKPTDSKPVQSADTRSI
eukprot:UN06944